VDNVFNVIGYFGFMYTSKCIFHVSCIK